MTSELSNLANYLNLQSGGAFNQLTLKSDFPTALQSLLETGALVSASPAKMAMCRDCDHNHFADVVELNTRYFIKCEYNEHAPLSEVSGEELACFRFNLPAFLTWLARGLGASDGVIQINKTLWSIGKLNSQHIYFIKSLKLEDTANTASTVNTENNLFVWLGDRPLTGILQVELLSIKDVLVAETAGLRVLPVVAKSKRAKPSKDGIVLDKDIVLAKNNKLLLVANNNAYDYEESILPQTYAVVVYLHSMRKYGKQFTSKEIATALSFTNPKVVPTRIKQVNSFCEKYKLKPVILAYPENKWALNPELICCR
jgi:hypothetical protein